MVSLTLQLLTLKINYYETSVSVNVFGMPIWGIMWNNILVHHFMLFR
jgi:hypothetical protein